jgi:Holliday junction resolvase RusA-like endonuclease
MGGGLKFLLDALTHNRVIMDDNPRCIIRLHLYQRPCKRKEEKTIVEIE